MSALYNLTKSELGSYFFATDNALKYTVFFIECLVTDKEGNNHVVYSFGFERDGNFEAGKFTNAYDEKIKNTILFIIRDFFKKNGDKALLYFCFDDDGFGRHRSIMFSRWHRDELAAEMIHIKKNTTIQGDVFYGGLLTLAGNPLLELLEEAVDSYIEEVNQDK